MDVLVIHLLPISSNVILLYNSVMLDVNQQVRFLLCLLLHLNYANRGCYREAG